MSDSERLALFRSILDEPESDTPRLVFADWLEEHDQPLRAEFIRLQCRLAAGDFDDPQERLRAEGRERQLLAANRVAWQNELPGPDGVRWENLERGFFQSLRVDSPETFFAHQAELFDATPLAALSLHRFYSDHAAQLAGIPGLSAIRTIDLEDGNAIGNAGLTALAGSPHLRRLRRLNLRANRIGPAGCRALATTPLFRRLETLLLDRNDLFEGVQEIAGSTQLPALRELHLSLTQSGPLLNQRVFRGPVFAQLRYLDLDSDGVDDEAVAAMAEVGSMTQLRALFLNYNRIGDAGATALAASPVLESVQWLHLRRNRIGTPGGNALARSPYLQQVRELILGENRLGPAADALRTRFGNRVWLS